MLRLMKTPEPDSLSPRERAVDSSGWSSVVDFLSFANLAMRLGTPDFVFAKCAVFAPFSA
jgi:hypothetical protein